MTKTPQRVDQFHNAVKAAGLYLSQINRKAAATLAALSHEPMTTAELKGKFGPRHGLGDCIKHKLAEPYPTAEDCHYQITSKGKEYLRQLQSANLI